MAIRALTTAATGMRAQQQNVDVIANNIANVNTTGYKRSRAEFEDLFYQHLREVGATATANTKVPTGIQVGTGAQLVAVGKIFTQGSMVPTEVPEDLAIDGPGFFRVQLQDGTFAYTRAGEFHRDEQGRFVTNNGFPMDPPIQFNQPDMLGFSVGPTGVVEVITASDRANPVNVGQIQISRFVNDAGLEAIGENLFKDTPASGPATPGNPGDLGFGRIRQGVVEASNVDAVRELVELIKAQRAYEINSNTIRASDQMLQTANNLRG